MINKHLKGLNVLRFFAALLVLIYHGVEHLEDFKIYSLSHITLFHQGNTAVDFFFVLSGFLITYLGIYEIRERKKIDFKSFFIRRILRIMPLYYLTFLIMFIFTAFIYPEIIGEKVLKFPLFEGALAYIFMIPNLVMPLWKESTLNIFWSIGVEEQFYILFPILIISSYFIKNKIGYFTGILITYIILYFFIKQYNPFHTVINSFIASLKFHFMLLGMLFAFIAHKYLINMKNSRLQKLIDNDYFQSILIIGVLIKIILIADKTSLINDIISGTLYILLILIVSFQSKESIFKEKISKKFYFVSYFGKISYGIYLLHPLVSYFLRFTISKNDSLNVIIHKLPFIYIILLLIFTLIVSHFSYNYYEKRFLKLKNRFK